MWFNFDTIDKNTVGLNSGILLFKPTDTMRQIFSNINTHIKEIKASGKKMPSCEDQAFFNYHFIKENKYDNKLIEKYALIYCIDPPPPPSNPTDIVICHFVWPIGNAAHKLGRMRPHVSHILKHYTDIFSKNKSKEIPAFLGNQYTWTTGWIRFDGNGSLKTKWAGGSYEVLDPFTVYANWAGIQHFLRFNYNYSEYTSVRLGDLEIVQGNKEA
jgi:hypothetical protein